MKKSGNSSKTKFTIQLSPRELGRLITLFALYIYDISPDTIVIANFKSIKWYVDFEQHDNEEGLLPKVPHIQSDTINQLYQEMFLGTFSNLQRIDKVFEKYLVKWNFDRLHSIDKAILRLSTYSMIYRYDMPPEVIIYQANELADMYSDTNSYKYINGILHSVKTEFRKNHVLERLRGKKKVRRKIKMKKRV